MPRKKKQHFVPRFLLKHFATDKERKYVNIFNANNRFHRQECPLHDQAQEDYFYGSDGIVEDALSKLESSVASIIRSIIAESSLPKRGTAQSLDLFLFVILLAFRTKNATEKIDEILNKSFEEIKKLDSRFDGPEYENLRIGFKNPAALSLGIVSEKAFFAYDLDLVLLVNKTKRKFVISDHPAVLYNQFLEERKHPGGHLGMFTKGLQLFLPISPDFMLAYYDKWAYKYGNKKDIVISLSNEDDITQLNLLQVVNCTDVVFSNNDVSDFTLSQLTDRGKNLREKEHTKMYEIGRNDSDEDGKTTISYTQHGDDRKIKLKLSFLKQREAAKSHVLNDFAVQLRDERMRNIP